jgi:glycosyltransferase involved in cell wall biosynthesis
VRVATYNHEKYIARCLESILMQKTNFFFEIIVGEDCSTDNTRAIVMDYYNKYPDKIRVILAETNSGGWGNMFSIQQACRGKYHAYCEGDDYWIDPLKLQKQVDFLESYPDYSMCFHDAFFIWETRQKAPRYFCPPDLSKNITFEDIINRPCFIPTASIVGQAEVLNTIPDWRRNIWNGDRLVWMWCAHKGKIGYMDEIMSVHFKLNKGMSCKIGSDRELVLNHLIYLYTEFDKETDNVYAETLKPVIQKTQKSLIEYQKKKRLGMMYYLIHPYKTVKNIYYKLTNYYRVL